ncbi:endothelin-converting enzyme homolog isoform X1 [Uloborus diversus]|uniref:endothelin-converting enzyme homolog isoform X1 n=1 Tax=Uloborus diversus TaxID=327109 RepID=UPI002409FDDE|nr:endothelin-converting enzyme homolog isoform X1 [Uloborus diversus]
MNGIQLQPLPRYKRTEFDEEETSSMASMAVDAPMVTSASSGTTGLQVRYSPGRKRNFWERASPLEKVLMLCVLFLVLLVAILSIVLDTYITAQTVKVVHISAVNGSTSITKSNATEYCVTPACVTVAAAILNAMDHTAEPCTDFYQYSCGGWIKSNPLPDEKSIWGTFGKLWQENQIVMKNVLEDDSFELKSEAEKKARTYYTSCLDKNETVDKLGPKPMLDLLNKVGGWNISGDFNISQWNFQRTLEIIHNEYNRGGLFSWGVGEDERNSTRYILQLDQGGLGLPTRDYYLNKSKDDEVLVAYLSYMTKVGVLLGGEENATRAQMEDVIEFETKLANITIPAEERRDDEELYHKKTISELRELAPVIDWTQYFNSAFKLIGREISPTQELVIYAPEFIRKMSELVTQYLSSPEGKIVISNYLGWTLVQGLTSCLSKSFREAYKVLRKALVGSEGGESPWRYCVSDTNGVIGFALGAMFVREVFRGTSKPMAETMINEIRDAFKENLPLLKWMDPETRKLAKEKADAITDMIGFPEFILDPKKLDKKYEGLEFSEDTYFQNNIKVDQYSLLINMKKLDKPSNRSEWKMTPPTVNAYYTPTKNQIVFPAGILQAPFYDPNYPKSLNFGAMGVVMGHELTHAFDDQGREYDRFGNLHQWWKNSTIESFRERAQCFVDQYSSFEINTENLNGKQTLGENIADNGGLKAAFHAYQDWAKTHAVELPLPGVPLTNNQLFFIGFAQVWCSTSTPEAMHLQILNDSHSPAKFRVIGTLSNSEDFAREFKCPAKSAMNPKKKCEVW